MFNCSVNFFLKFTLQCEEAKMESRQNRLGQSQFQTQRVLGQGQQKQGQQKQKQGQGYNTSDLSYDMERQLYLADNQSGGRKVTEMCFGQIVRQPIQQGQRQVRGQPGYQHIQLQGQRRQGHGQGQNERPLTPRNEMDQSTPKGQGKRQRKKKVNKI